jgi:purine-nucleoside phosphorylase
MSTHIGAKPGEIAETVLMPGDPYRARWAAETFLTDVACINQVRGMLGFTGRWNGHPVTIQGSGMGMPSLSIYANGEARGARLHVGGIYSSDVFYDERPDLNEVMTRHGILCVEMEAAELYTVAARHGVRALAILTISDHLLTHEALPAGDRERSFGEMIEIALHAAFA